MKILLIFFLLFLQTCTHSLHISHVSDFSPYKNGQSGIIVEANTEQFVLLGIATETNYVDKAYYDLMKECTGSISGITSQYSTSHGFFSWTNKLRLSGRCYR